MTPEQKQKLIDYAQRIADKGCRDFPCKECFFHKTKSGWCDQYHANSAHITAHAFLLGIAFEKGDL